MSYYTDQDQSTDYTRKYNENVGSISPKSRNNDSHLTSYHSNALFSNLYSSNEQQFNQNDLKQQSINGLTRNESDMDRITPHFLGGSRDSVTVYETENSPIIFSNDSPLSALSLEFLPTINPNEDPNFNNKPSIEDNYDQVDSYSNGSSLNCYSMETTPVVFSYDSPLSSLSLDMDYDQDLNPSTLDSGIEHLRKFKDERSKEELYSMVSSMSIDSEQKNKFSSTSNVNRKFGNLDNFHNEARQDGYSLLDLDTKEQQNLNNRLTDNRNKLNEPKSMNNNQNERTNQQESQFKNENECQTNDLGSDNGFDEFENEEFYLNKCIEFGRLSSSRARSQPDNHQQNRYIESPSLNSSIQPNNHLINQTLSSNNSNHIPYLQRQQQQQTRPEDIPYIKVESELPFNKDKDLLKKLGQAHQLPFNQQKPYNQQQSFNQQPQQMPRHPASSQMTVNYPNRAPKFQNAPCRTNVTKDKETDTATTITNVTNKYGLREQYLIDGKEADNCFNSVVNGPTTQIANNFTNSMQIKNKILIQNQDEYLDDERPGSDSCEINSPIQVKKGFKKKFLNMFKKNNV